MRRGLTCIVLCVLMVACVAATPVAGATTARPGQVTNRGDKHNAPPKLGSIRMKLLGDSTDQLVTDGTRWAAYEPIQGVTRLMDTIAGRTINRPDPEGCAGGLAAIGGGEILYECNDPECPGQARSCQFKLPEPSSERLVSRRYIVENIVSGTQHVVPGTSRVMVGAEHTFELDTVGSQWAGGTEPNQGYSNPGDRLFVNWHTGQLVYEGRKPRSAVGDITEEPTSNEEEVENLNSVYLLQPLCEPLKRLPDSIYAGKKYGSFEYDPPFAVLGPAGSGYPETPSQLRRCGSSARVTLPGGKFGYPGQLGDYVLSWEGSYEWTGGKEYSSNYVTRLNPHSRTWFDRIYRLALPKYSNIDNTSVRHTGTMIFATVGTSIYLARLPWVTNGR
jgi:hypothetical protein